MRIYDISEKLVSMKNIFNIDISIYDLENDYIYTTMDKELSLSIVLDDFITNGKEIVQDGILYYLNEDNNIVYRLINGVDKEIIISILDKYIADLFNNTKEKEDIIRDILVNKYESIDEEVQRLFINKQYMLLSCKEASNLYSLLSNICPNDYVIRINESIIVIIGDYKDEDRLSSIYDTIKSEIYMEIPIVVKNNIRSYQMLKSIFLLCRENITRLSNRIDGRMIYIMEKDLFRFILLNSRREYLNSIIDVESYGFEDILSNRELYHTIEIFMDANLNISEAARQLFVHRNTLIYRLNKINKITGLDIRNLEEAIACKALMVYNESI